jgi:hypothetical protein
MTTPVAFSDRSTLTEPDGCHYTFGYDALNRPIRLRGGTVYLCPDALTRGCGCLQDTILHEMVHGCGHTDESCPNCMAGKCTKGVPLCPP